MSTVFSEGKGTAGEMERLYNTVLHLACEFASLAGQDLPAAVKGSKSPNWDIVLRALLLKQEKCLVEAGKSLQAILLIGKAFESLKKGHVTEALQAAETALDKASYVTPMGPNSPPCKENGSQAPRIDISKLVNLN